MENNYLSDTVTIFYERFPPEEGYIAGYAALLHRYKLQVPLPDVLSIISHKHKQYRTEEWQVFTPRHRPEDTLRGHLIFALKYEGIELGLLKRLFCTIDTEEWIALISQEPTGQYSRKIWFLYEWLTKNTLALSDMTTGNYIDLVDTSLQFAGIPFNSKRHRVRNNLPGNPNFCPMIRKTSVIAQYMELDLSKQIKEIIGAIHPDVMARTAAFLLLKDSKASFAIEGEHPPQNRAQRWGRAIGEAGKNPLSLKELERLQQIVISDSRFIKMGLRDQEGFIGAHDRRHGTPIPEHISARWKDVDTLIEGWIEMDEKLEQDSDFDAVLAAAMVAFGFVFIHPFVDGNGRIHRYLIHHVLLRKKYVEKGVIFPVSSIILERLDEYQKILEAFSIPRLDLVNWRPDKSNNVKILNETIDLYRYFDATKQAEFLYSCVKQTIQKTVPSEVDYLDKYDRMKGFLDNYVQMPDKTVDLLIRFLEQGKGQLSKRAKDREFKALTKDELLYIQDKFKEVFLL